MQEIVGRSAEIAYLQRVDQTNAAAFLAVHGRRRVGKTHLVRCFFEERGPYLEVIGRRSGGMQEQLAIFLSALKTRYPGRFEGTSRVLCWRDAFELVSPLIHETPRNRRFTLFLDELPWIATARSGLLEELDHFWNARWSRIPNFTLVVCGSAASWMLGRLVRARGGLHNRVTGVIALQPFDLAEAAMFLRRQGCDLTRYQVVELYLALGGVPYYLQQVRPGRSPAQVIDETCFSPGGLLRTEFDQVFPALFSHADRHLKIIRKAAQKRYGISRTELIRATGIPSGGALNRPLEELEAAGFVTRFVPYGKRVREPYFRVTDEYACFFLTWIDRTLRRGTARHQNHWQNVSQTPSWRSWAGYSFEGVCQKHAGRILAALGISGVQCEVATWRRGAGVGDTARGAQVDLLFDRKDGIVTLVEIKFASEPYVVTREQAGRLRQKVARFKEATRTRKAVNLVLVSPFGTTKNRYSQEVLAADLTLDDLLR